MNSTLDVLLERYPVLVGLSETLQDAGTLLEQAVFAKKKLLVAGNGGSCADAEHIVGELMKSFVKKRSIETSVSSKLLKGEPVLGEYLSHSLEGAIPAICLSSHTALSTAFSNDVDPCVVYAQQVYGYGVKGDVFWGLSTSGNAKNVLYAAFTAKAKGLKVLGMTGRDGGTLKDYCDVCIRVPEMETYKVQELHLPIYHWLCIYLESCFW